MQLRGAGAQQVSRIEISADQFVDVAGKFGIAEFERMPDAALDQAQELMYQAFQEKREQRRIELANEALAVCPDCADAYALLAEHAPSRKTALDLYEKGVAAALDHNGPVLIDAVVSRTVLPIPPAITVEMAKGFTLYMVKAVFNGRGDDLVDLARSNLWA